MAIYRTDRERRILGDRVVAREAGFRGIDDAVGRVLDRFRGAHEALLGTIEERRREENEDGPALAAREQAVQAAASLYGWAYGQLEAWLRPRWDAPSLPEDVALVRERLFPLGAPSAIITSTQLTLDATTHLEAALARDEGLGAPAEFVTALAAARAALAQCVAAAVLEQDETRAATAMVQAARDAWDTTYVALRDVTSAFLRLAGRSRELEPLFRALPRGGSGGATDEEASPDATAEPVPEPVPAPPATPAT